MIDCEAVLDRIKKKIDRRMELNIPESDQYESCFSDEDGNYIKDYTNLREGYGWTRSFLTGAAAYMYFHYREEKYLDYLRRQLPVYDRYQYSVQDHYFHDTGFLFTLFSGALYEIAGDEAAYRMNIKAADDTLKGYVPEVGVVDGFSGGKEETTNPIIDDMMNISLLMWAWGKTSHYYYHRIFTNHIRNVKKYMLRDDFTFRHLSLIHISEPTRP